MKKFLLVTLVTLATYMSVYSQGAHFHRYRTTWNGAFDNFELLFGSGFTQFLGDAGGDDNIGTNFLADFDFDALRPTFWIGGRYRFNEYVAARIDLCYGILKSHDQYTDYNGRKFRNLGFRSPLFEWGGVVEFYFLPEEPTKKHHYGNRKGIKGRKRKGKMFTGYVSSGFNGFYFNPLGDYQGTEYELALLNTEGQGILPTRPKYDRVSFSIPINLGFRYRLSDAWVAELEFCYRKSFTDYMDDISRTYIDPNLLSDPVAQYFANPNPGVPGTEPGAQRGDPTDNDAYLFLKLGVSWKFSSQSKSRAKYP